MKVNRSTKCTLKFANISKLDTLHTVLTEYGRVVNIFIDHFWSVGCPTKSELLKPIVDIPSTWLSARLRKVAAREAIDMITAVKAKDDDKLPKPTHKGQRMHVSCTIADLQPSTVSSFDAWLHLSCIGNKLSLDIPIKFHKHYHQLRQMGKRLNSYIITKKYVQLCFEIETGPKKDVGE